MHQVQSHTFGQIPTDSNNREGSQGILGIREIPRLELGERLC